MVKNLLVSTLCHASLNGQAIAENKLETISTSEQKLERIILASQSEFRKRALNILGLQYECIPANINEKAIRDPNPLKMATLISEAKAYEIAKREEGIIVAGDTFLSINGRILEKPNSIEEAHDMLRFLSGKTYTMISGLAVYDTKTKKMRSAVDTCDITLRQLSENEIQDYCSRYPILKFAGAHETDGVVRFANKVEGNCCLIVSVISLQDLIKFLNEIDQDRLKDSD